MKCWTILLIWYVTMVVALGIVGESIYAALGLTTADNTISNHQLWRVQSVELKLLRGELSIVHLRALRSSEKPFSTPPQYATWSRTKSIGWSSTSLSVQPVDRASSWSSAKDGSGHSCCGTGRFSPRSSPYPYHPLGLLGVVSSRQPMPSVPLQRPKVTT